MKIKNVIGNALSSIGDIIQGVANATTKTTDVLAVVLPEVTTKTGRAVTSGLGSIANTLRQIEADTERDLIEFMKEHNITKEDIDKCFK